MAKNRRRTRKKQPNHSRRQVIRIDVLPDDLLLEIFRVYVTGPWSFRKKGIEAWQSLVHVCRRWRNLVLGSPRGLNLQLCCTPKTPRDRLDVWPALPLNIIGSMPSSSGTDNIVAALGQGNRVYQVSLCGIEDWQLEEILAAMQVPFPELTFLQLASNNKTLIVPAIPDSFLGGSAPRLRHFELFGIPFPGLPKLLSFATHLVHLNLYSIPDSGYISPGAMVALLSVLSSLESLCLGFQSPQSRPDWERRSPPMLDRSILPSLDDFSFQGGAEYVQDLVTLIDAPQLVTMKIIFFNENDFDCPRVAQFISRTPTLRAPDEAHVQFVDYTTIVHLRHRTANFGLGLVINISYGEPRWQLSSIVQVCNSFLPPLFTVEDLYLERQYYTWQLIWNNDAIENTLWLQLLLPFTAVKNLYLSKEFAPHIAAALQELVGGRIIEVLPSLQNIFVEGLELSGPVQENIGQFVAARELSDHPIVISVWTKALL